ncbi:MAG: hypothetical protein GY731_05520, partial [Gammaproteobacteria bacterium]|nr:hypothetical protein [Gammaproteobacteria bacterium]
AGAVADEDKLVIIGSQAILGQFPDASATLLQSMEADIIPIAHPEKWNLIDGVLGEGSPFHETFGYYADGVEEQTALLPRNWKDRLIPIVNDNTRGVVGLCLDIHDLLISKYCAGREKDLEFTREVVKRGMVERELLVERLGMMDLRVKQRSLVQFRIDRDFS